MQPVPSGPLEPIIENPFGVHDHDILCGRGAFVNGHIGNQRLRKLALERKTAFDAGNYTEKRSLASEIVTIIKALDPPGRFLKRASKKNDDGAADGDESKEEDVKEQEGEWEELSDEKSIHKACQVMRDIDRPDRKDREERRAKKKQKLIDTKTGKAPEVKEEEAAAVVVVEEKKEEKKEEPGSETAAVEEAVAATEAALDKALDAAATKPQGESVEV